VKVLVTTDAMMMVMKETKIKTSNVVMITN